MCALVSLCALKSVLHIWYSPTVNLSSSISNKQIGCRASKPEYNLSCFRRLKGPVWSIDWTQSRGALTWNSIFSVIFSLHHHTASLLNNLPIWLLFKELYVLGFDYNCGRCMKFQKGHQATLLDELQVLQIIRVMETLSITPLFNVSWIRNLLLQFYIFRNASGFTAARMYKLIIVLSRKSNSALVDVNPVVIDGTSLSQVLPSRSHEA